MITDSGAVKVLDFGLARSVAVVHQVPVTSTHERWSLASARWCGTKARASTGRPSTVASGFHTTLRRGHGHGRLHEPRAGIWRRHDVGQRHVFVRPSAPGAVHWTSHRTTRRSTTRRCSPRTQVGATTAVTGLDADLAALIQRLKSTAPAQRPTAVEAAERLRWIRGKPRRRLVRLARSRCGGACRARCRRNTPSIWRESVRWPLPRARRPIAAASKRSRSLVSCWATCEPGCSRPVGSSCSKRSAARRRRTSTRCRPSALSGDELFRRSQSMHQIGQIRQAEGNLKCRLRRLSGFDCLCASRPSRAIPQTASGSSALRTARFYAGEALRVQGDLDGGDARVPGVPGYRSTPCGPRARERTLASRVVVCAGWGRVRPRGSTAISRAPGESWNRRSNSRRIWPAAIRPTSNGGRQWPADTSGWVSCSTSWARLTLP